MIGPTGRLGGLVLALSLLAGPAPAQPDDGERLYPPSAFQGLWRLTAVDDPGDAGLMRFSVIHSLGEPQAHADFVIFQPFCGLTAKGPIRGDEACEFDGMAARFEFASVRGRRIVLTFRPGADGAPHRLVLRRWGDALIGEYRAPDFRRAVIARPAPQ